MPLDDDADDDASSFGRPLPPEDRLWRHPSELGAVAPSFVATTANPRRAPSPGARPWALALASGMLGAVLSVGVVAAIGGFERGTREVIERVPMATVETTAFGLGGVVDIAHTVAPAVTHLAVDTKAGSTNASGVLFRDDGYLLTNAHVVAGAVRIEVVLADGTMFEGKVVGVDDDTDIAVVKVDGERLPVAILGSATDLQIGEPAIAIGSPLGASGGPSVTVGVISALGRRVDGPAGDPLHDMIQTDSPIAPGASGGALVDGSGTVIGVTTAVAGTDSSMRGLGFATPIDVAHSVADDIIATGRAHHVWLGIEGTDLDTVTARELAVTGGARVRTVAGGSPAAVAGLAPDDVIIAVAGQPIDSMSALVVALRSRHPGDEVEVDYMRDGRRAAVTLRLSERPG